MTSASFLLAASQGIYPHLKMSGKYIYFLLYQTLLNFYSLKENVTLFRNLNDFWKLEELTKTGGDVVVVGSGFLGTELAYALGDRTKETKNLNVTQICRETGVLGAVLPQYLSGLILKSLSSCFI